MLSARLLASTLAATRQATAGRMSDLVDGSNPDDGAAGVLMQFR